MHSVRLRIQIARHPPKCRAYHTTADSAPRQPLRLRPYQEACVQACINSLKAGKTRCGVSLPPGSGKTVILLNLLSRIPPPTYNRLAKQSLILVNSIELALQTAERAHAMYPHYTIDIEQSTNRASGTADITIATWQSLTSNRSDEDRLGKYNPKNFKAIVVDEAHHAVAKSYLQILSHFRPNIAIKPHLNLLRWFFRRPVEVPVFGFSATFHRGDNVGLMNVFEEIIFHRTVAEMVRDKYLSNMRFTSVETPLGLKSIPLVTARTDPAWKDFNQKSLGKLLNTPEINSLVCHTWRDKTHHRKSTLVFCVNLEHLRDLTHMFQRYGVDARCLHFNISVTERRRLLNGFKRTEFPVLLNCGILTEGVDIPNVDCIIVVRPTRSPVLLMQIIGRGLRLSPETEKRDCHVIDFFDAVDRIPGLVTVPSLFGNDLPEDDSGLNAVDVRRLRRPQKRKVDMKAASSALAFPAPAKYRDYLDPFGINISNPFGDEAYKAWVRDASGSYVCRAEDAKSELVRVEFAPGAPEDMSWQIFYETDDKNVPQRRHYLAAAPTLERAMRLSKKHAEWMGFQRP